jgi:hypothetical protein
MSELRYPNEIREYRDARDLLLKEEQELIDKVKSVAERRAVARLIHTRCPPCCIAARWANHGP